MAFGIKATERGWQALNTNDVADAQVGPLHEARNNEFPLLGDSKPASAEREAEFHKWFSEEWKRVTCKYKNR